MKRFISSLFLILFFLPIFALYTIKGKIIDSGSQVPIDFANVALTKSNSETPATGVTTDDKGNFLLPQVPKGKYTLRVSFVGYNTLNIPLNVSDNELDMGVIKLFEDSKTLSEVEVVGQGSQMSFELDKKVFTVDKNIASAGGSASDVLQNIPSVDVDGEGNVSLRNNSSVEVWINGKPSGLTADNRAQVLQQMPAESIEKVEVMTNPSAKFKAEGTSGIINIVLNKKRKAGYYGSVSAGAMYVDKAKPTGTLGLNINYSSSKFDAYLNVGLRAMDFKGGGYFDRYGLNGTDTISLLHQVSDMGRGYQGLFGRAGVDYHINDKHTISLSGFGMLGSGYSSSTIDYEFYNYDDNLKLIPANRLFTRSNTGTGTRPSSSLTLDYRFDIDKLGSNLMSSFTLSPHKRTGIETIVETENRVDTINDNYTQNYEGNNDELEFKLDYTKIYSTNQKLELGINAMGETRYSPAEAFDNLVTPRKEIKSYYNNFVQYENNFAAYATYGSKYGNFTYQAGLRAEYFIRDWDNSYYENENDLEPITKAGTQYKKLNLFPSAFVSYSLPDKNELQLNVTRRIQRPHGREINPFRNYSDASNVSYGNPNLLPELSTAFELNHIKSWDNHTLSSSAYYRYTDDVMQSVQFLNSVGIMESTTMNLAKSSNLGVEFVAKNRILKIINLTSTLNLYYNKINASSYASIYNPSLITIIPEKELFSWNVKSMANVILGKNTFLQVTGDYSAPRLIAQGKESASYAVDLGLRQTLMNKNLSLNLMVRDVFNTRKRTTITYGSGFYQNSQTYFMGRMIGLTATYNFGNMKPKQSDKKASSDMNMDGGMD